jgi:carboxyl-terminal processing protease
MNEINEEKNELTPSSPNNGVKDDSKKEKKRSFRHGIIAGVAGILIAGAVAGFLLYKASNVSVAGTFLTTGQINKLNAINNILDKNYYKDIKESDKAEYIYKGLYQSAGDEYTEYYTKEEYDSLKADLSGSYAGIGAVLSLNKQTGVTISTVYEGSAAEEAGLKAGDILVSVDGKTVPADDFDNFVSKNIRGKAGTVRVIVYSRNGKENTIKVRLKKVVVPTVSHKMLENGIGYIRISQFTESTQSDFESALEDLRSKGMTKVIYDLRDNGGGMVDSVTAILDDILPAGKVVYTKDKNGKEEDYMSDDKKDLNIPAVVLVNENTASSAEIFTGAMRDFKRATIIGTKTFGKGIVQDNIPLNDGSAVKITVARYYTPSGECIHKKGIKPDIVLDYKFLGSNNQDYDISLDNQVQKAIETLSDQGK